MPSEDIKLDPGRIPEHVAIIMDGNGRWAKQRGMARVQGHNAGMQALKEIVKHSDRLGVKYLTVYAFSTENWIRPADEVSGIFKLLVLYVAQELKELNDNNVRVNILGDWSALPGDAVNSIKTALKTTENNTGLVFNIAINYGGRAEIARAAELIVKERLEAAKAAEIAEDGVANDSPAFEDRSKAFSAELFSVSPEDISAKLFTAGMPDPDLIIRTGGECRLSNFLLWQAAYAELVVMDDYWPDFTPEVYEKAIARFQARDRRFGGVK